MDRVDWKSRLEQLKANKDWDDEKQFTGLQRLGDSYHPIDPFLKFSGPEHNLSDRLWYPFFGGIMFPVTMMAASHWTRRPFYSNLPGIIAATVFGAGLGEAMWRINRARARDRDAVLMHYLLVHEDDFPRIERKKFKDVMRPWVPCRTLNHDL